MDKLTIFIFAYWHEQFKTTQKQSGPVRVWELAYNLIKNGHRCVVFIPGYPSLEKKSGVMIVRVPIINKRILRPITFYTSLLVLSFFYVIKLKPDILYVRIMHTFSLTLLSKLLRIPLVLEVHGTPLTEYGRIRAYRIKHVLQDVVQRLNFLLSDKIIAVSTILQDSLYRDYHVPLKKISVVSSGSNIDLFNPLDIYKAKQELGLDQKVSYVGFVGSFLPEHGVYTLIDAAPMILEKFPQVKFLFVGEGVARESCMRRVADKGLSEYFIFSGFIPYEKVSLYINAMDICTAPYSGPKTHGSPVKIFDYFACAKPVVASNSHIPDLLKDSQAAVVITPEDPRILADAIIGLLADENQRQKLGENGRKFIVENYNWELLCKKTIETCKDALKEKTKLEKKVVFDQKAQPASDSPLEKTFGIPEKLTRNTLYNAMGLIYSILISLILTPFIIRHIGIERFGVWTVVNILIMYFGFIDVGAGSPIIKYVSEFHVKKDFLSLNRLINTIFVFYFLLSIATAALGFIFSDSIIKFFNIPVFLLNESLFVIKIAIISFASFTIFSIFTYVLLGLQRMDITNKILLIVSTVNIAGTIFVLKKGYGLRGLIFNHLSIITLNGAISIYMVAKKLTVLKWGFGYLNGKMFKLLLSFGVKIQLAKLAFLINFQMDKLLLAKLLTISSVAFYEFGFKIVFTMRRLALLLVSAIMPAASEMSLREDRSELYDFYLRSSKYLILISTPFFLFGIFNARLVLCAWLGKGYEPSIPVIQVLALGYLIDVLSGVARTTAIGMGRAELEMKSGLLVVPVNLILSLILIAKMGLVGACIGTTISFVCGTAYLLKMFNSLINKTVRKFLRFLWLAIISSVASNLLIWPMEQLLINLLPLPVQISSVVILVFKWILYCLLYIYLMIKCNFFDSQDFTLAKQKIPFIKVFFAKA